MLDQASYFVEVVGDTIDREKAIEFQKKLINSYELEVLAYEILESVDKEEKIAEMEKISGSFIALGTAIKAAR